MDLMSSGDEYDAEPMSMDMLEDIRDRNQSHPRINRREVRYRVRNRVKQRKSGCKGVSLSTGNISKGLHQVFKAVVNDISQALPMLGESGSEVSYFITEPRNFA